MVPVKTPLRLLISLVGWKIANQNRRVAHQGLHWEGLTNFSKRAHAAHTVSSRALQANDLHSCSEKWAVLCRDAWRHFGVCHFWRGE
jgi:hypothetical protein